MHDFIAWTSYISWMGIGSVSPCPFFSAVLRAVLCSIAPFKSSGDLHRNVQHSVRTVKQAETHMRFGRWFLRSFYRVNQSARPHQAQNNYFQQIGVQFLAHICIENSAQSSHPRACVFLSAMPCINMIVFVLSLFLFKEGLTLAFRALFWVQFSVWLQT